MSRFSIWVEYDYGTSDLDAWIEHVAARETTGGGHVLGRMQTRDMEFEAASRPGAISLARRVTKVLKLARSSIMRRNPGKWRVRVLDLRAEDEREIWNASGREIGLIIKPAKNAKRIILGRPRRKKKK